MTQEEKERIYEMAVKAYGIPHQLIKTMEECSELITAISRIQDSRSHLEDIITELADVSIMVEQISRLYGSDAFEKEKERKLLRLKERIINKSQ